MHNFKSFLKKWGRCSTELSIPLPLPPSCPFHLRLFLTTASINPLHHRICDPTTQTSTRNQTKRRPNAHLMFSAVFGTTSANNSIFILPTSCTHNAKKKKKSCTIHKEDLQFDVYQMELKVARFHLSSYGYIEEYNRIWRARVTRGTWRFRHLWN